MRDPCRLYASARASGTPAVIASMRPRSFISATAAGRPRPALVVNTGSLASAGDAGSTEVRSDTVWLSLPDEPECTSRAGWPGVATGQRRQPTSWQTHTGRSRRDLRREAAGHTFGANVHDTCWSAPFLTVGSRRSLRSSRLPRRGLCRIDVLLRPASPGGSVDLDTRAPRGQRGRDDGHACTSNHTTSPAAFGLTPQALARRRG